MPDIPIPATALRSGENGGYDGTTYYGRPSLKHAPFENWVVGGYVFIAGLAGAAQLLSTLADLGGGERAQGLVRRGRFLSLLGPVIGAPLLIYDLHTPKRFYNMLRIFRRTSPMSIGTWVLMSFSLFSFLTAGLQAVLDLLGPRRGSWLRRAARATQVPAAIAGAGLGTYTAALLSATSTPLWAAAPKALAVRFGSSSIASGAAALSLVGRRSRQHGLARDLDKLASLALAIELGATVAANRTYDAKGISAAKDAAPVTRAVATAGTVAPLGLHAVSLLLGRRESAVADLASLAILAGSLCLRVGIMEAGDESARRPRDSFRFAKPGNLPGR